MTNLSPTAQAVLDAYRSTHLSINNLAAALRAAADQVVPIEKTKAKMFAWQYERLEQRLITRGQLLAIATELDGDTQST